MVICKRCLEQIYEETMKQKAIEVCKCGHGKVHHNGTYGDCTCPITYRTTKCQCQEFVLVWGIWNNQKMTAEEYYMSLQNTLTQESQS